MGQLTQSLTEIQSVMDQQYDGDQAVNTGYDDIPTSIATVKLPPSNAPSEVFWDHGIGSGVTFPTLGFNVGEYVYAVIQSPHAMKLQTVIDQHIHFSVPSDGTGDKFNFQIDVISACVDCAWAVPTGSPFTTETTMTDDYTGYHKLTDLADIPGVNDTVSTLYKLKLTRIAASADEYAGQVYVDFFDGHFQRDQERGSRQEYVK